MHSKRIEFIYNSFGIVDDDYIAYLLNDEDETSIGFLGTRESMIAIKPDGDNHFKFTTYFFDTILTNADPTKKKAYTQWILNVFNKFMLDGNTKEIEKYFNEDLSVICEYLEKFNSLKKTNRFKEISKNNYSLKHIQNPTDINQYSKFEELYDAIFPFLDRDVGGLEKRLLSYHNSGDGIIELNDKNYLLFIPKTTKASSEFENFASWCTARKGNTMFNSYTKNNKRPDGSDSKLYVIIKKKPEDDNSNTVMQLHFETNQIMDSSNRYNLQQLIDLLTDSKALDNYFKIELSNLVTMSLSIKKVVEPKYLDLLKKLDYISELINMYPDDNEYIEMINIKTRGPLTIKNFEKLKIIKLNSLFLNEFPKMKIPNTLEIVSLSKNNLTEFPKDLINKNIKSINLKDNQISDIPDEIIYMTKQYGGSLVNLSIGNNKISPNRILELESKLIGVNLEY